MLGAEKKLVEAAEASTDNVEPLGRLCCTEAGVLSAETAPSAQPKDSCRLVQPELSWMNRSLIAYLLDLFDDGPR